MGDSDTLAMGTAANLLLESAQMRKGKAALPEAAAVPLTWRDVVIGEVPTELRHPFVMCSELVLNDDDSGKPSLTQFFGRQAVPEVMPHLFKKLHEVFPNAKDLRISTGWKVAERRSFFESILRQAGLKH